MPNITLISTVHKEIGKCNADELCEIIEKISPEVIFLEALEKRTQIMKNRCSHHLEYFIRNWK